VGSYPIPCWGGLSPRRNWGKYGRNRGVNPPAWKVDEEDFLGESYRKKKKREKGETNMEKAAVLGIKKQESGEKKGRRRGINL